MTEKQILHPPKEQLVAFGLGKLNPEDGTEIESHLDACAECYETMLELQDDTFVALVKKSPPPAVSEDTDADASIAEPSHTAFQPTVLESDDGLTLSGEAADLPRELQEHNRYRILDRIGHGGMGDVYKAEHMVMNRPVALKVIKPELVRHESAIKRFHREVQAAARLHHPNIVTAHDAEQAGNSHFLVMEFVDGVNLDEVLKDRGPLLVEEVCDAIRQTAIGLEHAHGLGMVHRDIKPHNLMLTEAGDVKILDFGLASFVSQAATEEGEPDEDSAQTQIPTEEVLHQLTQMGTMMGTPDYIAPEQAKDARKADIRADIYSLGCTFYTLLTGKPPFKGESVAEKLAAHAQKEPEPLSNFRDDVPEEVETILKKMMAKDPAERYQTPLEVSEAIQQASVGRQPHEMQPASVPAGSVDQQKPKSRIPRWTIAVASLIATMIAFAVYYIQTDYGVVRIEVADESLKVELAGETITMKDAEKELTIRAGAQKLFVKQGDLEFYTDDFQLGRGEELRFKVELSPGEIVVMKGGERFGGKRFKAERHHTPQNGLKQRLESLVADAANGISLSEMHRWIKSDALPQASSRPYLSKFALEWLGGLSESDRERLLQHTYLKWDSAQLNPSHHKLLESMTQYDMFGQFDLDPNDSNRLKSAMARGAARMMENIDVGFAVINIPDSNDSFISWYSLPRAESGLKKTLPLVGLSSEVRGRHGNAINDALKDQIRKLRNMPSTRLPTDSVAQEWNRLAGRWRAVSLKGKRQRVESDVNFLLVVDAEKQTMTFHNTSQPEAMQVNIQPLASPKQIEFTTPPDDPNRKTGLGIYRLDGDELTICFNGPFGPRPISFTTQQRGGGDQLIVFRRANSSGNLPQGVPSEFLESLANKTLEDLVREQAKQADPPVTDVRNVKSARPQPSEMDFEATVAGIPGAGPALLDKLMESFSRPPKNTNTRTERIIGPIEENGKWQSSLAYHTDERTGLVLLRLIETLQRGNCMWTLKIEIDEWSKTQRPSPEHATVIVYRVTRGRALVSIDAPGYSMGGVYLNQKISSGESVDSKFLEPYLRNAIERNPALPVVIDIDDDINVNDPETLADIDRVRGIVEKIGARVHLGPGLAEFRKNEIRVVFDAKDGDETLIIPGELTTEDPDDLQPHLKKRFQENPQLVVVLDVAAGIKLSNDEHAEAFRSLQRGLAGWGFPVKLAPRLVASRENAVALTKKHVNRKNDLKQIRIALNNHADSFKVFPPGHNPQWFDKDGKPYLSWRVHLLPFIEHEDLYKKFKLNEPWDSEQNIKLLDQMPGIYKTTDDAAKTTFLAVVGEGTAYEGKGGLPRDDDSFWTDGRAVTALVVDAGKEKAVPWTKPEDLPFDKEDPIRAFGTSDFPGKFLAVMVDTSVQTIPYDTDPEQLRNLFLRADGNAVDLTKKRTTPLPVGTTRDIRIRYTVNNDVKTLDIQEPGFQARGAYEEFLPKVREVIEKNPGVSVTFDVGDEFDLRSSDDRRGLVEARFALGKIASELGTELQLDSRVASVVVSQRRRQFGELSIGLFLHEKTFGQFPIDPDSGRGSPFGPDGKPRLSWRVHVLPFMGKNELFERFAHDEPWDSPHNKALLAEMPDLYRTVDDPTKTTMQMVVGKGTAYEGAAGFTRADLKDSVLKGKKYDPSKVKNEAFDTAIVVDAGREKAVPWTKPEDLSFDFDDPIRAFGSSDFGDKFYAIMHDTGVKSIPYDTDPEQLRNLFLRADGNALDLTKKRTTPLPNRVRAIGSGDPAIDKLLTDALAVYTFEEDTFYREQGRMRVRDVSVHGRNASIEDDKKASAAEGKVGGALACNRSVAGFAPQGLPGSGIKVRGQNMYELPMPKLRLPEPFLVGREEYTFTVWVKDAGKGTTPSGKSIRMFFQEGFPKGNDSIHPLAFSFKERKIQAMCLGQLIDPSYKNAQSLPEEDILPKGEWFFLALTLTKQDDKSTLRITVNDKTIEQPFAAIPQKPAGGFGLVGGIDGMIDELAFFKRALSDEEIQKLRQHGLDEKPLIRKQHLAGMPFTTPLPESVWPELKPVELTLERTLKGHTGSGVSTASLGASADGKLLISAGGKDKTARLWDTTTGETVLVMPMEKDGPASVAITADGKMAAVRGTNGLIDLWDLASKKKLKSLDQTEVRGSAMAFSADGKRLVTGALPAGKTAPISIVWDIETGKRLHVHRFPFDEPVGAVVAVPGMSDVVFTAKRYWRWNTKTGNLVPIVGWPESLGGDMDVSPDGKLAAIITNETISAKPVRKKFSVEIRSLETGELVRRLDQTEIGLSQKMLSMPTRICFLSAGDNVAVSYDSFVDPETMNGKIRVFDVETGREVASKDGLRSLPGVAALDQDRIALTGLSLKGEPNHDIEIWRLQKPDANPAAKTDYDRLLGKWKAKTGVIQGKAAAQWGEVQYEFLPGKKMNMIFPKPKRQIVLATVTLDENARPKTIDFHLENGGVRKCLYELADDELLLAMNLLDSERPKRLMNLPGDSHVLIQLERDGLYASRIKKLVSEAAGITVDQMNVLGKSKGPRPKIEDFDSKPLTAWLFSIDPQAVAEKNPNASEDFRFLTEKLPKPLDMARALMPNALRGYASFIQPEYITKVTLDIEGDTASGEVSFEKKGLYRGKVLYTAKRSKKTWQIEELDMPNLGIKTVRDNEGKWSRKLNLETVQGTVTLDGKPLADAKLVFHPLKGKLGGSATTDQVGKFTQELPPGQFVVTVEKDGVPAKYTGPQTSGLRVEIQSGDNEFKLELK